MILDHHKFHMFSFLQFYGDTIDKFFAVSVCEHSGVPGWDYFAICADTENNGFAIFEADQTAK